MNVQEDKALRRAFNEIRARTISELNATLTGSPLILKCNHPIGHKTVSEIGGRIIEDFLTSSLEKTFSKDSRFIYQSTSSRSLGDFVVEEKSSDPHRFYFDVKAQHLSIRDRTLEFYRDKKIKAKKPGESHPNLISFEKAKDFFSDSSRAREDIAFVMIHYDPVILKGEIDFKIKPLSLDSIFLLRDIDDHNLSFGNLGKGQIQLKRVGDIRIQTTSKLEFVEAITNLASKPRSKRASSRA